MSKYVEFILLQYNHYLIPNEMCCIHLNGIPFHVLLGQDTGLLERNSYDEAIVYLRNHRIGLSLFFDRTLSPDSLLVVGCPPLFSVWFLFNSFLVKKGAVI